MEILEEINQKKLSKERSLSWDGKQKRLPPHSPPPSEWSKMWSFVHQSSLTSSGQTEELLFLFLSMLTIKKCTIICFFLFACVAVLNANSSQTI